MGILDIRETFSRTAIYVLLSLSVDIDEQI
jgi:hypothetical protein